MKVEFSFQDYISQYTDCTLNEAKLYDITTMMKNFDKVFPYSTKQLKVIQSYEKNHGLNAICKGIVKSEHSNGNYTVYVQLHKKNKDVPYTIYDIMEVRCNCNAFRYNVAYPDLQNKELYGRPAANNRIPNRIRNPKKIPSVCKHLYAYIVYLVNKGILKKEKVAEPSQQPNKQNINNVDNSNNSNVNSQQNVKNNQQNNKQDINNKSTINKQDNNNNSNNDNQHNDTSQNNSQQNTSADNKQNNQNQNNDEDNNEETKQ